MAICANYRTLFTAMISSYWRFLGGIALGLVWPFLSINDIALYLFIVVLTTPLFLGAASKALDDYPGGTAVKQLVLLLEWAIFWASFIYIVFIFSALFINEEDALIFFSGLFTLIACGVTYLLTRLWPLYAATATLGWRFKQRNWIVSFINIIKSHAFQTAWQMTGSIDVLVNYGLEVLLSLLLIFLVPVWLALNFDSGVNPVAWWVIYFTYLLLILPFSHLLVVDRTQCLLINSGENTKIRL